ncbi:MAG: HK97 family phage prohead protease [Clostridia bacterium]|nr:HK97 family phage prohead protease [Clostridia bacterium]
MKINIRADSVEIEGYVNAVERDSNPLWSRMGQFIERICKGAFKKALQRNKDVKILLNHNPNKVLGSTARGNLELAEDNIGLKARAVITDPEIIRKARNNELIGWSFGFYDRPNGVIKRMVDGILHRAVEDLDLDEVSILDNTKTPAYEGTLIMARDGGEVMQFRAEPFIDEVITTQEQPEEKREEPQETQPKQHENVEKNIDYFKYEQLIKSMKEDIDYVR